MPIFACCLEAICHAPLEKWGMAYGHAPFTAVGLMEENKDLLGPEERL